MIDIDGWFDYADFYDEIIDYFDSGVFVEIGVWKGKSIKYLATKAKRNTKIFGVDNFKGSPGVEGELPGEHEKDVDIINGTLYNTYLKNIAGLDIITIRGESYEVCNKFDDESVDFVFIDGDHHYEIVLKDIQGWFPKVKKGGIISGHDYAPGIGCGVIEAVNQIFPDVKTINNVWYKVK